jgi:hypothetical protein
MQLYSCRADSGDWALGWYLNTQVHVICHNFPMCGRYRLSRRKQFVEEYFDSVSAESVWTLCFHIAPTQPVEGARRCTVADALGGSFHYWRNETPLLGGA